MNVLKRLGRVFAAVIGLIVAAYLVLLAINWRDQPPSATVRQFEQELAHRPNVADADNAYLFTLGFGSPPDSDPMAIGLERRDWIVENAGKAHPDSSSDPLPGQYDPQPGRSPAVAELAELCRDGKGKCIGRVVAQPDTAMQWLAEDAWLLDRYDELISKPEFLETIDMNVDAPLPSYAMVFDGQRLLFVSAYLAAADSDEDAVLVALNKDLAFWRMVLANSDLLITKVIATAAITYHFDMGNQVLRVLQSRVDSETVPETWLAGIDDAERSVHRTLVGEWQFSDRMMKSVTSDSMNPLARDYFTGPNWLEKTSWRLLFPFWQAQDLSNRRAALLKHYIEIFDVPYREVPDARKRAAADSAETGWRLGGAYNLAGRLAYEEEYDMFIPYVARVLDLEGVRRAAAVTALLREARVMPTDIAGMLDKADLTNPYTGKPFGWDEQTGEVIFVGLEKGPRGEHRFRY